MDKKQVSLYKGIAKTILNSFPELKGAVVKFKIDDTVDIDPDELPEYIQCGAAAQSSVLRNDKDKKYGLSYVISTVVTPEYLKERLEKGHEDELKYYLNSMNIELNESSYFVFNILHELGHVRMYHEFMKLKDREYDLLDLISNQEMMMNLIFRPETMDTERAGDIFNEFAMVELYADKFAYRGFPRAWQAVNDFLLKNRHVQ